MSWFSIDLEANGPYPPDYSMVQVGAVLIDPEGKLDKTFYGELAPIDRTRWVPEALQAIGITREETYEYPWPYETMREFEKWIEEVNIKGRPMMLADNAGFDWMFINYYFHVNCNQNPFGWSCLSLTSLYKGFVKDMHKSFKHLRKTRHTHNPVDDAMGNAEAFLELKKRGLK